MAEQTPQQLDAELADAANHVGSKRPVGTRLTAEQEAEIEQRRAQNLITAAIAGCSWGKSMSSPMRRAYADYCHRYDVDPVTEMDNLGGSVYVNADWYRRKLGELRLRGIVKDYWIEHIQADVRLEKLRNDQSIPKELRERAQAKWFDMLMRRVEHNAPENAAAICVCTIDIGSGTVIKGCKWAGNGTSVQQPRHNGGSSPNPIAENNPTLFVETSSIRRACVQLFSHLSGQRINALPSIERMDEEINSLAERMATSTPTGPGTPSMVPEPGPQLLTSGYDELAAFEVAQSQMRRKEGDPVPAVVVSWTAEQRAHFARVAEQFSNTPDPYGDPSVRHLPEPPRAFDRQNDGTMKPRDRTFADVAPDPERPTPFDPEPRDESIDYALRSRNGGEHWTPGDDAAELVERLRADDRPALEMTSETPPPSPPAVVEKPKKKCVCGNMVSGPWTNEHVITCGFYQSPPQSGTPNPST